MNIIKTKDRYGRETTFDVVDKIPKGYIVWNIGNLMGSDEHIPLAMRMSEDKNSDKYNYINPNTLKAIKLTSDEVKILRDAAKFGINSKKEAEKTININPKEYFEIKRCELSKKSLSIFERISE